MKIIIRIIKYFYHSIKKIFQLFYVNTRAFQRKCQNEFYNSPKFSRLKDDEKTERRICFKKKSAVKQFADLVSMIKIQVNDSTRFQHWLDTGLYYSRRYPLNGECPPNYSIILNNSINELVEKYAGCSNKIEYNNYVIINSVKTYICRIVTTLDNYYKEKKCDNILKSKVIFENMLVSKAISLEEAFQRILFWSSLFWQTGHSLIGLGRLDKILASFDMPSDTTEVKALILDFFDALHQYYGLKSNELLGDTGQLIILGGKNLDGSYFCNKLTYLFIECLREYNSPDPKILLRVANNMPEDLLQNAITCISTGNGSPLLSNDERIIPSLIEFGYSANDAYDYVTSACWEPFAYGKSIGNHNLAHLNIAECFTKIVMSDAFEKIKTFDELKYLFIKNVKKETQSIIKNLKKMKWEYNPLMTFFTEGCLEKNKDISKGGAIHSDLGFLTVGFANAVDSLFNIKKFVFDTSTYSLSFIKKVLKENFNNAKEIQSLLYAQSYYGHDKTEYIDFVNSITKIISEQILDLKNPLGGKYCFGLSSFGYMNSGKCLPAMADGRYANDPLSVHISCKEGLPYTELVNFASKLNYSNNIHNGNLLDYIVSPDFIKNNFQKFLSFIQIAIKNGFFQMQMNVVSSNILLKAKENPSLFPNLIVRVWGFSAYFKDLPEEYKTLLIKRAMESEH